MSPSLRSIICQQYRKICIFLNNDILRLKNKRSKLVNISMIFMQEWLIYILAHLGLIFCTKQFIIRNPIEMRNVCRSKGDPNQKYCSPYGRKKKIPNLQNILEEIKHLQNCVSQFDIEKSGQKQTQNKLKSNKSVKKHHSSLFCKSTQLNRSKQHSNQLKRQKSCCRNECSQQIHRSQKSSNKKNCSFKNESQTFAFKSFDRRSQSEIKQQQTEPSQFVTSFLSLQVQNLKLQNQNLNLEKQLLQQELLMQKRQKQLLKNKIKRIKTHNISNKPISHNQSLLIHNAYNQFKVSPIRIRIPEIINTHQQKLTDHIGEKIKTAKKSHKGSDVEDTESLLISDVREKVECKQNVGILQKQFWTLLTQCQKEKPQKKWEIREALGDVANRLRQIRKN